MIGRIGGETVKMPPYELLGRFTTEGEPDRILNWIEAEVAAGARNLVISSDMAGYGGLIASRVPSTTLTQAKARLNRLTALKRAHPELRVYAFSAIMRLAPTATVNASSWRMQLAQLVELEDRIKRDRDPALVSKVQRLRKLVPEKALIEYRGTRERNYLLQGHLLAMVKNGTLDYLILGQDDAKEFGPHVSERNLLMSTVVKNDLDSKVFFCEGIDQLSNVLVSRAILRSGAQTPRVRIIYSDPATANSIAPYESQPIRKSLEAQIFASGARPAVDGGEFDYTLFVNTPNPKPAAFQVFSSLLNRELAAKSPVAVADINLGASGVPDQELFNLAVTPAYGSGLLSYAGWNTAGNTLGTAIPAANLAHFERSRGSVRTDSEIARCEFLLHRYVNDFAYHRYTRPAAYQLIDELPGATREEVHGLNHDAVNLFVRRDVTRFVAEYFRDYFFGKRLSSQNQPVINGVEDIKVWLPWPRAYEVRIEFKLVAN
jgi:hypothetical protein